MQRTTLALEAQEEMARGESLGECWETIGVEDHRVKCIYAEDYKIKERTDCSSHEQPAGREDKDSMPSAKGTRH